MESNSQMFGGAEECHSSESGWTMYLGSSINGDEDEEDYSYSDYEGEVYNGGNGKNYYQEEEEDSDDSMASDASSGPSTHQLGLAHLKLQQQKEIHHDDGDDDGDDDDGDGKCCDEQGQEKKNVGSRRRIKDEKEQVGKFKARKSHNFNNENTGKKKHLDGKK
ncbi:hypothetical protein M5689_004162 [Euphorbia peplus]|nr:hypothetical protein M5689_004162 [Euphorbia peplus]